MQLMCPRMDIRSHVLTLTACDKHFMLSSFWTGQLSVLDTPRASCTCADFMCRSGSMYDTDRQPVANTPASAEIIRYNPNRLGAVLSALYGFWVSRSSGTAGARRDAYSVILFESSPQTFIANDLTSTPDQLLGRIVSATPTGGTHFDRALESAKALMETHWSTDR